MQPSSIGGKRTTNNSNKERGRPVSNNISNGKMTCMRVVRAPQLDDETNKKIKNTTTQQSNVNDDDEADVIDISEEDTNKTKNNATASNNFMESLDNVIVPILFNPVVPFFTIFAHNPVTIACIRRWRLWMGWNHERSSSGW